MVLELFYLKTTLILEALIAVARAAHALADDTEDDGQTLTVCRGDFNDLSNALDVLDALPDPPFEASTGPRKAEYLLGVSTEQPAQMTEEALRVAARRVAEALPPDHLFLFLAAPKGDGGHGRMVYTSNMDRQCAINVLKEWLIQASGPEEWMKHLP